MNIKSQPKDQERRDFIKKSTLVGAGVAAATMASTSAIADMSGATVAKPSQKGYQLTQHVLDYYKSADI
ncbi:MAG: twin-arginine translocation signal domain-containing protein [Gammaproteobacteria bacterium]|nr:twin-arginine translocation signal domain-containing protein [Gammaproteobacteria bacterium]MDH3536466.1 twin-arginine translocation signal domain-containing protein [Gammaproteobacteria bacterium]